MEKTLKVLRGVAVFLMWVANVVIAYAAAHSLVPHKMDCLPLAFIFYWLLEAADETKKVKE